MKRPHFKQSLTELEVLYETHRDDEAFLLTLIRELDFRKTSKAKSLRNSAALTLDNLRGASIMSDNKHEKQDQQALQKMEVMPPVESSIKLNSDTLDLSGLDEAQISALKQKHAEMQIEMGKKAIEMKFRCGSFRCNPCIFYISN